MNSSGWCLSRKFLVSRGLSYKEFVVSRVQCMYIGLQHPKNSSYRCKKKGHWCTHLAPVRLVRPVTLIDGRRYLARTASCGQRPGKGSAATYVSYRRNIALGKVRPWSSGGHSRLVLGLGLHEWKSYPEDRPMTGTWRGADAPPEHVHLHTVGPVIIESRRYWISTIWMFISRLADNIRTKITGDAGYYLRELNRSFGFSFGPQADGLEPWVPL